MSSNKMEFSSNGDGAASHSGADDFAETGDTVEIDVTEIDLPNLTARAIEALAKANDPPMLFRRLADYVRVEIDENKRPIIKLAGLAVMRRALSRAVIWTKIQGPGKNSRRAKVDPPRVVVENVIATPEIPLPALRGITSSPFFTENGKLVVDAGYDSDSKLFLMLDPGVIAPAIPRKPTPEQVRAAVYTIYDLYADFPFAGCADRAHAFAMMFSPFAREMIWARRRFMPLMHLKSARERRCSRNVGFFPRSAMCS